VVLDEWLAERPCYIKSERPNFKIGADEYIYDLGKQMESMRLLLEDLTYERACFQDIMDYECCPSDRCELKEEAGLYDQAIMLYKGLNGLLGRTVACGQRCFKFDWNVVLDVLYCQ
jgi:hypothetical protein